MACTFIFSLGNSGRAHGFLASQSDPAQTRESLGGVASLCAGSGKSWSTSETGFSLGSEVVCVTGAWPVLELGCDINFVCVLVVAG